MRFGRREDRSYYRDRAETEIEAAHSAVDSVAARVHYTLAAYYLDLAYNPESTGPAPSQAIPSNI